MRFTDFFEYKVFAVYFLLYSEEIKSVRSKCLKFTFSNYAKCYTLEMKSKRKHHSDFISFLFLSFVNTYRRQFLNSLRRGAVRFSVRKKKKVLSPRKCREEHAQISGFVLISNELWLRCSLCLRVKVEAVAATGVIRKHDN